MSFGHALYYPHINLRNKNWIKHALLFWDNISRIVPASVSPSDDEDIIRIKYETGFIKDYLPMSKDTTDAFREFIRQMRPILESDQFYHDRFNRREYFESNVYRERHTRGYDMGRKFFSEMVRSNGTYIHIEKLDPTLMEYLISLGLALPGQENWEGWVKVDDEIGLLYMTYFAKSISKNNSLPIVTDVEKSFSASLYFESSSNSDYQSEFEYRLGNLLIETAIPKNINEVPIDKILKIRNKYDSERTAFFNEISSLATSITHIDNQSALEDALNQHSKILRQETNNLEKLYNSHGIESVNKFLTISLPSALVSLSDHIPNEFEPYTIAGGTLFGLISAASSIKKDSIKLKENPKSYLLSLRAELGDRSILKKINDTVRGMRNWR